MTGDLEREVRTALEAAYRSNGTGRGRTELIVQITVPVVVRLIEEQRAPLIADLAEMTREARLSREATEKAVIRQRKAAGALVEVRANLAEEVEFHGHMARERDLAFEEADQHRIAHKMAWERAEKAEADRAAAQNAYDTEVSARLFYQAAIERVRALMNNHDVLLAADGQEYAVVYPNKLYAALDETGSTR